jgi:hypothetical protein
MRRLSAVAFFVGISAACTHQPAATAPPATGAGSEPGAGVPARPSAPTAPRPFTQSPWSPATQPPEMWGQGPTTGANQDAPLQRR